MGMVMGMLLLYTSQHIGIVQTSYDIHQKEKEASRLVEDYKNLRYQVNLLKTPARIEQKLKEANLNFVHPTDVKLVHSTIHVPIGDLNNTIAQKPSFMLLGNIEFIQEAYADSTEQ